MSLESISADNIGKLFHLIKAKVIKNQKPGLDYENEVLLVSPLIPNGMNYWIHWDLNIRAPISKFMYSDEANDYLRENKLVTNHNTPPAGFKTIKTFYVEKIELNVYSMTVDYILRNNTAGVNGEHLTWEQIIELYK